MVICSAASKSGRKVLQIDSNGHYGGMWASLPCLEAAEFVKQEIEATEENGCHHQYAVFDAFFDVSDGLKGQFIFDLSPRLLYGAGPTIDVLLGSGAHWYTEFKLVEGRYIWDSAHALFVPIAASKAEIFKDSSLSLPQKHALMRILKSILGQSADPGFPPEAPISNLLEEAGCEQSLRDRFLQGVLMTDMKDMRLSEAKVLVHLYVNSCGRYGPESSPFLYPVHGCGEMPQAFCRTAAVHGAVQCLRCKVLKLRKGSGRWELDLENGQTLFAKNVVTSSASLAKISKPVTEPSNEVDHMKGPGDIKIIIRACIVVRGKAFPDEDHCFAVMPHHSIHGSTIWIMQLNHSTAHSPHGYSILHAWTALDPDQNDLSSIDCVEELQPSLSRLIDMSDIGGSKLARDATCVAKGVYGLYFSHSSRSTDSFCRAKERDCDMEIALCNDPGSEPTFRDCSQNARTCYTQICREQNDSNTFPLDMVPNVGDEEGNMIPKATDSDEELVASLEAALD